MNNSSMFSMTFKLGYEFNLFIRRQIFDDNNKSKGYEDLAAEPIILFITLMKSL